MKRTYYGQEYDHVSSQYNIIGERPLRPDLIDKVTGKARFAADYTLPNMLHGAVLRSDVAHARIKSIDTRAAEKLAGVRAVVTGQDFAHLAPGGPGTLARDNLAIEKVLYHGQALAAVAATSRSIARKAAKLIKVKYEKLTPVMTLDDAMAEDAPTLYDHIEFNGKSSNILSRDERSAGDIERGFADADEIVELEFNTPTVHQGYVEPPVCLADYNALGQSTLWAGSQGHFPLRSSVATMMQMEQSALHVVPAEVGGAFGGKTAAYQEAIAMMLSKKAGRPVQMRMTREDVFRAGGPGAASKIRVKVGAKRDGCITAAFAWMAFECGVIAAPLGGGMRSAFTSYDIPNVYVEGYAAVVNKPRVRAYRGPGAPQVALATENAIDELAARLNMDPIEIRLKNAVRNGSTTQSEVFKSIGLVECLEAARNSAHYKSRLGKNQGRAVAAGFWHNGGGTSSATIHMNPDGTVSLSTGSVDLSGTRIALAMMSAEELGVSVDQIASVTADTDSVGFADNSAGSRTINTTGQAVVGATREAIEEMKVRAASGWNVTPGQVTWQDGNAVNDVTGERLSLKEICRDAQGTGGPISGTHTTRVTPGIAPSFSVHVCDVDVDPETGKVTLLRYTTVQDAGTAIHRDAVEGQMQGGAVQGIGWALNEEYVYNNKGALENPGFLDYRIPLTSDLPMIETIIVEVPNELHPYGVRGVGEAPIIPPLAAVAGAVSNAIGVRITRLPCSPPNILAAIEQAPGK
ncbi:MAG: oxidoreductase [Gammaproteobacteria bacterium]|nr:oxidoreductase [Gammaproteobacteria bacterium]RPG24479.1 MAG: xanthine dehydrogenase family protein molybdopterin-binding subunit [Gammaproteobacteria bacterium TMED50]